MYAFEDKNGDNICLRPEGTAGILRSMIQHNMIYDRGIKNKRYGITGLCLDMKIHKRVGIDNSHNLA